MDWRVTYCRVLFNMIDQTPWTIRLDAEKRMLEVRETRKRLRQDTDNKPLQNFEDMDSEVRILLCSCLVRGSF